MKELRFQKKIFAIIVSTENRCKNRAEFIRTHALSHFLMLPRWWGFISLSSSCQKVKSPWRRVWTLRLRWRPPLMQWSRVLFQIWIIWIIGTVILIKRNMAETDVCRTHMFVLTAVIFPFAWTFYTFDEKCKKRMLSPSSLNSFYYFSLFYRIEFKTQFKIEFCPPVNGGQLWCWNKPWHVWHVLSFVGITTFRKYIQHHPKKECYWDIAELDFSKFSFL